MAILIDFHTWEKITGALCTIRRKFESTAYAVSKWSLEIMVCSGSLIRSRTCNSAGLQQNVVVNEQLTASSASLCHVCRVQ